MVARKHGENRFHTCVEFRPLWHTVNIYEGNRRMYGTTNYDDDGSPVS